MLFFSFSKRDAWIPQDRPDESVLSTEIFSRSFFDSYGLISLYIEGSLNCRVPCLCFFSPTNTLKFFSMEFFFQLISYLEIWNLKLLWLWNMTSKSCCIPFRDLQNSWCWRLPLLRSISALLTGFSTWTQEPSLHGAPCLCQTHTLHEWYITYITYWFIIKIN